MRLKYRVRWRRAVPAWLRLYMALGLASSALAAHATDLMVAAASSLTNAFTEIGKAFEKVEPNTRVLFTFAASGQLVQQISRGAPVDVLAAADQESMDRADTQRLIYRDSRINFAANKLFLVAPADSTAPMAALQDLARPQIQRIALGNPDSVPVGRYARAALEKVGLWESIQPKLVFTQNVRQSLDYVARGEVDAGFVYATDAAISPVKLRAGMEVPTEKPILYPIAATKNNGNERRARAFIAFVRSPAGQAILGKYGFLVP